MVGKTHCLGGTALALATASFVPAFNVEHIGVYGAALFIASSSFGSLIPDVDTNSTISNKPVFNLLHLFFKLFRVKHRGLTHSLIFTFGIFLLGIILGFFLGNFGFIVGAGISIGVLSHIILDILNPRGVQLLYPLKFSVNIAKISTGTLGDLLIRMVLILINIGLIAIVF